MELSYFILMLIISLLLLGTSTKVIGQKYDECKKQFICGGVNITYPFYDNDYRPGYCGYPGFQMSCNEDKPEIVMPPPEIYNLTIINITSRSVTVARDNFWEGNCPNIVPNGGINLERFRLTSEDDNITFYYGCQFPDPASNTTPPWLSNLQFTCSGGDQVTYPMGYFSTRTLEAEYGNYFTTTTVSCQKTILVPVNESVVSTISNIATLQSALLTSFELEWYINNDHCDDCRGSGGECGSNGNKFACYCPDSDVPSDSKCKGKSNKYVYMIVAATLGSLAIGTSLFIVVKCYFNSNGDGCMVSYVDQDVEAYLKTQGSSAPKRYKYADLKKITNSFKEKLGEGGFGTVYKGKLHNGQLVAVKLLKKSKGNAEEFINEVASIGRTNHVNVVTLLGFCLHGHKKALIYDYMPNGSLEKFVYRRDNHQTLTWEKLFEISVGIARGLEYLHRGCNIRILHFDIKPHNILLDGKFCPKISDFGLAKSYVQKESVVSMSGARGTVGFIAPEVFLRGFGGVSYKSDVYSYGMLVLEMVGCRKKSNLKIENISEEYFPQWIYRELEQVEELDHQGIVNGDDKDLKKKMILVGLWCIQTNPSSRPTMTRVVEMLEGTLESLQHPPVPSLISPSLSLPNSSIADTISL